MLSRLLKEHQARQSERRELQERRRREAIAAATRLTEALVDHLNGGTGIRQPAEAGPRGEDAAGAGGPVRQADWAVDHHGGELQPGPQGDRRRGELGSQHRDGHADHRHRPGVRLQGAAPALLLLSRRCHHQPSQPPNPLLPPPRLVVADNVGPGCDARSSSRLPWGPLRTGEWAE